MITKYRHGQEGPEDKGPPQLGGFRPGCPRRPRFLFRLLLLYFPLGGLAAGLAPGRAPVLVPALGAGAFALGKASRAALRVSFLDILLRRSLVLLLPSRLLLGDGPDDVAAGHDAHEPPVLRHRHTVDLAVRHQRGHLAHGPVG